MDSQSIYLSNKPVSCFHSFLWSPYLYGPLIWCQLTRLILILRISFIFQDISSITFPGIFSQLPHSSKVSTFFLCVPKETGVYFTWYENYLFTCLSHKAVGVLEYRDLISFVFVFPGACRVLTHSQQSMFVARMNAVLEM